MIVNNLCAIMMELVVRARLTPESQFEPTPKTTITVHLHDLVAGL
jgi:hypothetical protein